MEYSFGPLIDENSKILILGSLPGVRSLAEARYYAHPQNKFCTTRIRKINSGK